MDVRDLRLPFRVGATSYVIEDGLAANARHLSRFVQDMQLVLFDLPDGPSNLPDAATVDALRRVGQGRNLTYTVHLMDDLRLRTTDGQVSPSLARARQVIDLTRDLDPHAYVLHLDGAAVRAADPGAGALAQWQHEATTALSQVAAMAGDPALLAVENLEGYPPGFVTPVITPLPVSRCVDVGHLWLDGHDPVPHLRSALASTRVVHIHGVGTSTVGPRDHASLAWMEPSALDPVIDLLLRQGYRGVLSLEVFGEADFTTSLDALIVSVQRCRARG